MQQNSYTFKFPIRLQNSPYFCLVKYAQTVKRKVWRFFPYEHVRLMRFACARLWPCTSTSHLEKASLKKKKLNKQTTQMKSDSRSKLLWLQFIQLRLIAAWKKFEPVNSWYRCNALTNWVIKPLMLEAVLGNTNLKMRLVGQQLHPTVDMYT